jgi:catechol 2,3-dioxygenase-like lactoylglutathione lyase family enzyme
VVGAPLCVGTIHRAAAIVRDVDANSRFYRNGLGLDLLRDRQVEGDRPVLFGGLLQLHLPVGRVPRKVTGPTRLGRPDVVLDGNPVGAFAGSKPGGYPRFAAAMAWRLRRP